MSNMTDNSSPRDGRQSPFSQSRIISNLQRRLRLAEEGWQYNHETLNMLISSIRATDFTKQEAVTAFLDNVNQLFSYGMEDAETDTDVNDNEDDDEEDEHAYAYDENGVRHEVVPWIMNIAPPRAG